jgi:thiol:disulfide interchange protein DsbD
MYPSRCGPVATRLLALLSLLLLPTVLLAQQDASLLPVTEAYKLTAQIVTPGTVQLHWTIAPDYYLYRGRIKISADPSVSLGAPQLPDGAKHDDPYLGPVETYHNSIDASVPYSLNGPAPSAIQLSVQYQGCHEVDPKICYPPYTAKLSVPLPPGGSTAAAGNLGAALSALGGQPGSSGTALPAEQAFRLEALVRSPQQLLLRWSMPKGYYLYRQQTQLSLLDGGKLGLGAPAWPTGSAHHDKYFGDSIVYYDQLELPVPITGDSTGVQQVQLKARFQGCQQDGVCYPPMERTLTIRLDGSAAPVDAGQNAVTAATATGNPDATAAPAVSDAVPAAPPLTLLLLLLALAGGLLLNLLPCVLPVLSLKVLGVLENSGEVRALRRHALFYTLGVLLTFTALDLIAHAFGRGLGAQLQNPIVVAVLVCVMLAVGLSLSGLYQFGASLGGTGQSLAARKGPLGDFFTGVLAVVVASPCTGPLMGPPVAYALTAPLTQSLAVFLTLGLGLALPLILISVVPSVARMLPRPGAWMETLKQALAFPMYLTAVWLVWVLANQRGADAVGLVLAAAVVLAMALWWFERSRYRGTASKALVLVLLAAAAIPLVYLGQLPPPTPEATVVSADKVPYSPEKLAELRRNGTPVLVDMTADWCVTCKANEHAVLDSQAFRDLLKRTGAVYMVGDWTDVNPVIEAFLKRYHSPGVPLYVVFPHGGGEGKQLPNVLTHGIVEQALTEAAK